MKKIKTLCGTTALSLLKLVSQGDRLAFWELWLLYDDYLSRCCLKWMGGNQTDAEEALSLVKLKAWEKLPKYAEKITNLKPWLTRMTYNLCLDLHRQRKRNIMAIESIETVGGEESFAYCHHSPESAILHSELRMLIYIITKNLSSRLRSPFILHFYQGIPYPDIAQKLGISQDNVYKRIQEARKILQPQLKKYLSGIDNSFSLLSLKEEDIINNFYQDVKCLSSTNFEQINYEVTAISLEKICWVKGADSLGLEFNVQLISKKKPIRQEQKIKTLLKYVKQYPSGWKKRLELADLLYERGNWEQAIKEYRQVIQQQPQLINVCVKLSKILELMKRQAEAIQIYEKALKSCNNLASEHHIKGLIAVCKNQKDIAIKAFDLATSLEPENSAHWLALGQVQIQMKNEMAALKAFEEILLLHPDDLIALINSYDALLILGNFQEAEIILSKLAKLYPDEYLVLKRQLINRLQLKLVFEEEGKHTKKMVTAIVKLAPYSADAHQLKAQYYHLRKDKIKAVAVLAEFTKQYPNNPQGWEYLEQCLQE
ncbi:MAG: sigma-70 family RNA polymerase sigma factor [Gomphosphaeria aponina SAG 52.96 = DSM 107014]|uniref:Sigma-70 family RNA polymerase sigma factor n=1 Tax=Gomphosphaeria aponina SAG 52.96 = DSM 107014 TaxID=1521640 RepID=A0A941GSN0_9CHRO|nr:sigma-70 family RNA polymerase sigma factor [Gomphosphaeria aponina SAG 52.96 = DSM 107014]